MGKTSRKQSRKYLQNENAWTAATVVDGGLKWDKKRFFVSFFLYFFVFATV